MMNLSSLLIDDPFPLNQVIFLPKQEISTKPISYMNSINLSISYLMLPSRIPLLSYLLRVELKSPPHTPLPKIILQFQSYQLTSHLSFINKVTRRINVHNEINFTLPFNTNPQKAKTLKSK